MRVDLETIEETRDGLAGAGYLADERTALVSFLASRLGHLRCAPSPAALSAAGAPAPASTAAG